MLNWFDIAVISALAAGLIAGINKGLVMQLVGVAGIIAAIVFGGKIAKHILPILVDWFTLTPQAASIASFLIAFVLIMLCFTLVGKVVQSLLRAIQLGFMNRMLGGFIAVAIITIILSLVLNLILTFDTKEELITRKTKSESRLYTPLQSVAPTLVPYLRKEVWKQYLPENNNKEKKSDNDTSLSADNKRRTLTIYFFEPLPHQPI